LLALLQIVQLLLNLVWWVIMIQAVMSWLIAFNIINTQSNVVRSVWEALDLSPLVVLLILYILTNIVVPNIAQSLLAPGL